MLRWERFKYLFSMGDNDFVSSAYAPFWISIQSQSRVMPAGLWQGRILGGPIMSLSLALVQGFIEIPVPAPQHGY